MIEREAEYERRLDVIHRAAVAALDETDAPDGTANESTLRGALFRIARLTDDPDHRDPVKP